MHRHHSILCFITIGSLIAVLAMFAVQTYATPNEERIAVLEPGLDKLVLDQYIDILIETDRSFTIEEIATGKYDALFEQYEGVGRPNLGYNVLGHWVRFQVSNETEDVEWLLEIEAPKLNYILLYSFDWQTGTYVAKEMGNNFTFHDREVKHRNYALPLNLEEDPATFYVYVETDSSVQLPLTLWEYTAYHEKSQNEYAIFGVLFGISIVMALYNLFLYFSIRDRSYLYYVLFVLLNTLLYLTDTGLDYQYLWQAKNSDNSISVTALMFLNNIGGLLFVRRFLSLHKRKSKLDRLFKGLIILNIIAFIIRQFTFVGAIYTSVFFVLCSIFLILYASGVSLRLGYRPARFLLISWGLFLFGVFISLMVDVGMVPLTLPTKYAWQITTLLEIVLLSFALGDKYKVMKEEKEQAVQEANKMQQEALDNLKRTDKLKDEFLAITSHELQTPLNGMIGIAETMRAGAVGQINPKIANHLSMIIESGQRLSHLIHDILDYANLKNDQLNMTLKPVRVYEVTNVVLTGCQPLIQDKPIQLVNAIDRKSKHIVFADEGRIQQILYNLVGNAIKYTEEGKVIISARVIEDMLQIRIRDTGIGIAKDQLTHVFKQFYQVEDSEIRSFEGSGIGLNITKQLVEKQGGQIGVESVVGEGSTFCFTLPLYDGPIEMQEIKPKRDTFTYRPPQQLYKREKATGKAKILITDDDMINLQVLTNQLHLAGYEVITAKHGAAVLEIVQQENIDLLILDIMMPKMSGFEVCQQLRETYTLMDLPILMLTAKAQLQDRIIAFKVGANDYLTKPCDREELLARVNTLIKLSQLNNELKDMNIILEDKVKQRTEALETANKDLEKMSETRKLLLANIAHDLGTPVTVIYNYIQALDEGIIPESDKDQYLDFAYNKIKVLNRLINDLFDLSKLEAEKLTLNIIATPVYKWLQDIIKKLEIEVTHMDRIFTFESVFIDEALMIHIDDHRMDQIFSNLIKNAINHTEPEVGEITFRATLTANEEEIIFEITDNGTGIAADVLPFIFERYYKAPKTTEEYEGSGVGLAIVKELVVAHEGHVWVTSKENEGTTFYLALPIR